MQEIVYLIHSGGDFESAKKIPLNERFPFIEMCRTNQPRCIDKVVAMPRPRLVKTHLYYHFFEKSLKSAKPKIIVVFRNPKDCLVSYYHFYKGNKVFGEFEGDFNDFFELYKHKRIVHGDFFDFSLSWWDHKDEDNVMFTSYEEMKKNVHDVIRKVASFLEKNITDELVNEIAVHTMFDNMKVNPMTNHADSKTMQMSFMRKGQVGDWKNYFTTEQSELVEGRAKEVEKQSGIKFIYDI